MGLKSRVLSLTAGAGLAVSMAVGVSPVAHAAGPSQYCNDGAGNEWKEIPIITSPVVIAMEIGSAGSPLNPHVAVCYGTAPEGTTAPQAAGGYVTVDANPYSNPLWVGAASLSDSNSAEQINVGTGVTPTYSLSQGPAGSTGDTIQFAVPIAVCSGQCLNQNPAVNPTGLIVGELVPEAGPPGSVGAAYQLSTLSVYVNGTSVAAEEFQVGGAFVNTNQVGYSLTSDPVNGPCVLTACAPIYGYIDTSGTPLVTIDLPATGGSVSLGAPAECAYHFGGGCP